MKQGFGTFMDLSDATAQLVLNNSVGLGKQRHSYYNGTVYTFQPDNAGGYHGYPEIKPPEAVVNKLYKANFFDRKMMKKLLKGRR